MSIPSPISVRPFSPSESWSFPKPPNKNVRRESPTYNATSDGTPSEYGTVLENPFADFTSEDGHTVESYVSANTETTCYFAAVETIRRPFVPTMSDEMAVTRGVHVRMLRRFSDGWAYAENVDNEQRGLIPIDCLRDAEHLPAFVAAKRLSSNCSPVSSFEVMAI